MVEPDCVTDDFGWEPVTLVGIHHRIIDQRQLSWQYLRECSLILIRCRFWAALAPPGRGHPRPVQAVRTKDTVESGQVHSGPGYQGGEFGDEIHWLEDDLSRAITMRDFQLIANIAVMSLRAILTPSGRLRRPKRSRVLSNWSSHLHPGHFK